MTAIIKPFLPSGTVKLPSSKSICHRALIASAIAKARVVLDGFCENDDIRATMGILSALGCKMEKREGKCQIDGKDFLTKKPTNEGLDCNLSASTLRFLMPFALLTEQGLTFTGGSGLFLRSQVPFQAFCEKYGFVFEQSKDRIFVQGCLQKGDYEIDCNLSSQFASGLLMALSCLEVGSTLKVVGKASFSYLQMTREVLEKFGFVWNLDGDTFVLEKKEPCTISEYVLEGDASAGAIFTAWKTLGANLEIGNMPINTWQKDSYAWQYFTLLSQGFAEIDISDMPDLAPLLFAFAHKHGGRFLGVGRLKEKECDRLDCMISMLESFGVATEIEGDTLTVFASEFKKPSKPVDTRNDHRMVFAGVFLASFVGGEIANSECVSKSFAEFWEVLASIAPKHAIQMI